MASQSSNFFIEEGVVGVPSVTVQSAKCLPFAPHTRTPAPWHPIFHTFLRLCDSGHVSKKPVLTFSDPTGHNLKSDVLHCSLNDILCHVICLRFGLDMESRPKFYMNLVWQQILFRLQNLYINTSHRQVNKLKIGVKHSIYNIKSACHTSFNCP